MDAIPLVLDGVPLQGPDSPAIWLEVPAHKTVSVTGDAGSGVDRLGRLALGLEAPSSGTVTVLGTQLASLSRSELLAYRRQVGYLPAGDGLLQNLSLRQNIGLPLLFGSDLSEGEVTSRLNIMLAAARIADVQHVRPAQASDVQRRRAALARALAFDPKLVVLEEPFAGLNDGDARRALDTARGGETSEGSRRSVLVVGPMLPASVTQRIEVRYKMTDQGLEQDA